MHKTEVNTDNSDARFCQDRRAGAVEGTDPAEAPHHRRVRVSPGTIVSATVIAVIGTAAVALNDTQLRTFATGFVSEAIKEPESRGFQRRYFLDQDGAHPYVVFIPHTESTDGMPMLVSLNGMGENGRDGIAPMLNGLAQRIHEVAGTFPFIAVFPQCHADEPPWKIDGPAVRRALAIIDQTRKEYRTDPDRVYLTGLSSGGYGVWTTAATKPEQFAAIAPVASTAAAENTVANARLPVFTFLNRVDQVGMEQYQRLTHHHLIEAGCDSRFVDVAVDDPESGAHNAWDFAYGSRRLYPWLLRHSRSSRSDRPPSLRPLASGAAGLISDEQFVSVGSAEEEFVLELEFRPSPDALFTLLAHDGNTRDAAWQLVIARADENSAFLTDHRTHQTIPGNAEAALSIRCDEWNHLRIAVRNGRISVLVNDWQLLDAPMEAAARHLFATVSASIRPGGSVEVAEIRCHGIEERELHPDDNPPPAEIPDTQFSDLSIEDIVIAWKRRQELSDGRTISCSLDRSGNGRWSRFQAALPHGDSARYETQFHNETTTIVRPWNYPGSKYVANGFGRNLSRQHHLQWMAAFREGRTHTTRPRQNELVLSNDLRVETLFGTESEQVNRQLITKTVSVAPGMDPPEYLFCRIPQLIYEPMARRGFHLDPEQMSLAPAPKWAQGRMCLVLEQVLAADESAVAAINQVFVDPTRDFVIVKFVHRADNGATDVITIDYDDSVTPTGWRLASCRPTDPLAETTYAAVESVVHFGIATVDGIADNVSQTTARSDAPTIICDRTGEKGIWTKRQPNGRTQPLAAGEIREILFDSSRSDQMPTIWTARQIVFSVVVPGLALVFAAAVIRLRKRSNTTDLEANPRAA